MIGRLLLTLLTLLTINASTSSLPEGHVGAVSSTPESLLGGLPVSNFAIAAQVPSDGSLFGHIWRDNGRLGDWLIDCGPLDVTVEDRQGHSWTFDEFSRRSIGRDFPITHSTYRDARRLKGVTISTCSFCPLVAQDAESTALPVIMLEMEVRARCRTSFTISLKAPGDEAVSLHSTDECAVRQVDSSLKIPLELRSGQTRRIRVAIVAYDHRWVSASQFSDAEGVAQYAFEHWEELRGSTEDFGRMMPRTGDPEIDRCVDYYMLPALILTRMTSQGVVLTMGYVELNQRDSFWTSWLHLVLFRDLEWQMIEESYSRVRDSGKIPTCLYPKIDRKDDLDINLFLVLRTARYYAMYHNDDALRSLWPRVKQVMDWVVGRDFDGQGLPEQVSFWCDWKDVQFIQERKYSAFVSMLYLASLDQMSKMARICSDDEAASRYSALYDRAYELVNRPVEQGGQWNGRFYAQIMKDGTAWPQIFQDQMVGVMYDVVPQDRSESIMDSLNEMALTQWGVCNMAPYIEGIEYEPGVYHNGAMWPWMSYMDCWARIRAGRRDEALVLVKRVMQADLVSAGDYVPNEHINTVNGDNLGVAIQGWNADLYGLLYFGLLHPELPFKL